MPNAYSNIDIVDLQDKDLVITKVTLEGNIKSIYVCKPREKSNQTCSFCGRSELKVNSYYKRTIKFLDVGIHKSIIIYNQRRYYCECCHRTFNETSSLVDKGSIISNQTKVTLLIANVNVKLTTLSDLKLTT